MFAPFSLYFLRPLYFSGELLYPGVYVLCDNEHIDPQVYLENKYPDLFFFFVSNLCPLRGVLYVGQYVLSLRGHPDLLIFRV
jgi:hypothetical protein